MPSRLDTNSQVEIPEPSGDGCATRRVSRGICVMLVDNSLSVCRDVSALLSGQGYKVVTAADGFEALSKIKDCRPDLVLLDITLPRLDGYQTCALIRHDRELSGVPVVMLSGPEGLYDRARGRFVGADHYLTKPLDQDELLATVERFKCRRQESKARGGSL